MAQKRKIRHKRVRAKISGTTQKPRLSVYRSNKHLFLQLIDDEKNKTLLSVSDREFKSKKKNLKKSDAAYKQASFWQKKPKKKILKKPFLTGAVTNITAG